MKESGKRVKFRLNPLHQEPQEVGSKHWQELDKALAMLSSWGWTSEEGEGRFVGNVALREGEGLLVSRSGREHQKTGPRDYVRVVSFNPAQWTASYMSWKDHIEPTSDTPLYWAALIEAPKLFHWKETPGAALHGHAFQSAQEAADLNIPISERATEFSTPEDREELMELLRNHPYPENKVFIRKGHGFFVLGKDMKEAMQTVYTLRLHAHSKGLI